MISFVIRNRNEAEFIGFAIQSILDLNLQYVEIIIVDNNSTDDSLDLVRLFKNRISISIINIDNYSPGRSINCGIKKASGNICIVMSAHVQIIDLLVEEIEILLKDYVAVMGKQTPIYRGKKISKRYIWSHFGDESKVNLFSSIEDRYFLHNALCAYSRLYLLENPFDESYPGKEDRFWAIDQVAKGRSFYYAPNEMSGYHFYTGNGATWKGIG